MRLGRLASSATVVAVLAVGVVVNEPNSRAFGQPCGCCDSTRLGCSACAPWQSGNYTDSGDYADSPQDLGDATSPSASAALPQPTTPDLAFSQQSAAFAGSTFTSNGGYVASALIRNWLRFRVEAAYDFNRPDRAEFFYTTWQSFGGQNPNPPLGAPDPDVNRQELSVYLERAFSDRFSVFVDLPLVFTDASVNPNDVAVGDMQAGFKYALWQDCNQVFTFRLNSFIPTAKAESFWVGTGHYSLEPGFLYYGQLTERWILEGELRDWIPIGGAKNPLRNNDGSLPGSDFAGNVLRYGMALSYNLVEGPRYRFAPVLEFVGWSVLDGQVTEFNDSDVFVGVFDADGQNIVNIKVGGRLADYCGGSIYAGWGHSLTDERWYEDVFRVDFRRTF